MQRKSQLVPSHEYLPTVGVAPHRGSRPPDRYGRHGPHAAIRRRRERQSGRANKGRANQGEDEGAGTFAKAAGAARASAISWRARGRSSRASIGAAVSSANMSP